VVLIEMGRSRTAGLKMPCWLTSGTRSPSKVKPDRSGPCHRPLPMITQLIHKGEGDRPDQILSLHRPETLRNQTTQRRTNPSRRFEPHRPGDRVRRLPLHPRHYMRIPMQGELR
jgi:hypothetical protein